MIFFNTFDLNTKKSFSAHVNWVLYTRIFKWYLKYWRDGYYECNHDYNNIRYSNMMSRNKTSFFTIFCYILVFDILRYPWVDIHIWLCALTIKLKFFFQYIINERQIWRKYLTVASTVIATSFFVTVNQFLRKNDLISFHNNLILSNMLMSGMSASWLVINILNAFKYTK